MSSVDLIMGVKDRLNVLADGEMLNSVQSAAERRTRCRENMAALLCDLRKIEAAGLLTAELADSVSIYSLASSWGRDELRIDRADLPKWREIGRLKAIGKDFDHDEPDTGKCFVKVTVEVEGLERLRLEYVRELPQGDGSRCRVVEQVSRYKSLQCSLK